MKSSWRYLLTAFLILSLSFGASYLGVSGPGAKKVAEIDVGQWTFPFLSRWKVEDIAVCESGSAAARGEAWLARIGPGPFDDLSLVPIVGINTDDPELDVDREIVFLDPFLDGEFPAGMGPRGTPGMEVDLTCQYAYIINFFLNAVTKVDLNTGEIVWETSVVDAPVDLQLTDFDNRLLMVASSKSNQVTVLDAETGDIVAEVTMPGADVVHQGPTSIAVVGKAYAYVLNFHGRNIACVDLTDPDGIQVLNTTEGLGVNPFQIVTDTEGRVYVSNSGDDSVSVLAARGCLMRLIAEIPVGDIPRHMTLTTDPLFGRHLYVSNALRASDTDNTKVVHVINSDTLSVEEVIEVAGPTEPAPLGVVAVSTDNRYFEVLWEGGGVGTPGKALIYHYATDP